jgi:AraC-like DNA-binding protein
MADCAGDLYNSDIMKFFIQTTETARNEQPQLLRIEDEERTYRFNLRHATLDQRYPGRNWCRFREHAHDVYHIVLYTEGSDELLLGDTCYPVGKGSLALIAPGDWHDVAVQRKEGIVYSEATFDFLSQAGEALRIPFHELLSRCAGIPLFIDSNPAALKADQVRELERRFAYLMAWLDALHPLSLMEVQRGIGGILAFLARECCTPHPGRQPEENDPIGETRRYIEQHYRERLPVNELAERAGFSRGHFLRRFKRAFGLPPAAYQQRLRIQAACTLLRYTEYPCRTIAERVGYDDEYLFSKTFKKVTGETPTAYRKKRFNKA